MKNNYIFSDFCDITSSKRIMKSEYVQKGIPFYRSKEIIELNENKRITEPLYISKERFYSLKERFGSPKKGDILITSVGTLGVTYMVNLEYDFYFKDGNLTWLKNIDETIICKNYLIQWLKSSFFFKQIDNNNIGAVQKALTISFLNTLEINLPNLQTQKAIAKVLSDLDAKIALNNKINQELEAMAKTLYDYWFVQFDFPKQNGKPYKSSGGKMVYNEELKREIPEGWDFYFLGDLGNFKNGVNYDPSKPGEIACPIINVRNISKSSYFLKNEDLDIIYLRKSDVNKYAVHKNSIIIARSGIPGATRLIADFEDNTLYCGFAIHFELKNYAQKFPVFFYLKSIEEIIKSGSGGTILKNVNQATLNNLKISLPKTNEIIKSFNEVIKPIFHKINLIQKENQHLTQLRDWLLPMLMNGQVQVASTVQEDVLGMVAEPNAEYGKDK